VTNTTGVDLVLVLICVLGVIAFETVPRIVERKHDFEGIAEGVKAEATGFASALMERLHHHPQGAAHRDSMPGPPQTLPTETMPLGPPRTMAPDAPAQMLPPQGPLQTLPPQGAHHTRFPTWKIPRARSAVC